MEIQNAIHTLRHISGQKNYRNEELKSNTLSRHIVFLKSEFSAQPPLGKTQIKNTLKIIFDNLVRCCHSVSGRALLD